MRREQQVWSRTGGQPAQQLHAVNCGWSVKCRHVSALLPDSSSIYGWYLTVNALVWYMPPSFYEWRQLRRGTVRTVQYNPSLHFRRCDCFTFRVTNVPHPQWNGKDYQLTVPLWCAKRSGAREILRGIKFIKMLGGNFYQERSKQDQRLFSVDHHGFFLFLVF
jgi:hypothetical protein